MPAGSEAALIATGLLSVLAVRTGNRTYLVAGLVGPALLQRVAVDLAEATPMITTRDLTKRYGRTVAVDGVDLDVREGDRYGLLGPNGSGKTTLVRMLLGLVFATRGEIEVLGRAGAQTGPRGAAVDRRAGRGPGRVPESVRTHQPGAVRRGRTGHRAGATGADGSARRWSGSASAGIDRRPVRAYSLGMRQRLGLAGALLRQPQLLILDEPTNGLDPRGIREVRDLLTRAEHRGHHGVPLQPPARARSTRSAPGSA